MIADADLRFLSALPYFSGLSGDELAPIAGRCQWREPGEGALIAVESNGQ